MKIKELSIIALCCTLLATNNFAETSNKVGFLGVTTAPVNEALTSQLELPRGIGLVVLNTEKDSPASKTLEKHDIIVKLNDQKIINSDQLTTLVQSEAPGTKISLEIKRKGKSIKEEIILAEKSISEKQECRDKAFSCSTMTSENCPPFMGPGFPSTPEWFCSTDTSEMIQPDGSDIQQVLKSIQMSEDWDAIPELNEQAIIDSISNAMQQANFPGDDAYDGFSAPVMDFSSSASTTIIEDDGTTITMTSNDKKNNLNIKDKDGKVVFNGPITTDKEKEKVPEKYKYCIKEIENISNVQFPML